MEIWIFWVLFLACAALAVFWVLRIERVRLAAHVKDCQAAAARMSASYQADAPEPLIAKIKGFDLTYSDGEVLRNAIRDVFVQRSPAGDLYCFLHEHRGSMPGGVSGSGHRETVGCLVSKRIQFPRFRLAPERTVEKLAALVGVKGVDFDAHPAFSRSYFLNASDDTAVRRLFDASLLDFFSRHPGFHVEGNVDTLVLYRFNKSMSVGELPDFFELVRRISTLFNS